MKRIITSIIVCLTLTILTAGFAAAATITVRADSWAPYNGDPGSTEPGYMIEVAKAVFEAKGHQVDYQLMPWTRSLDAVAKGTYDAVVGADKDEAANLLLPSESFGVNESGFYVKKGSAWSYQGIESLSTVRLGVIDGYGYNPDLDDYIEKNRKGDRIFVATGDDALTKLLKMLKAGRLDVVVDNFNVMTDTLKTDNLAGDIVNAGNSGYRSNLYIAFSPGKESSQEYVRIFDEGIVALRNSGKLAEILSRYGLNDWK